MVLLVLFYVEMTVLRISNASSRWNNHSIEYLMILRSSWFVALEDLSQSCDVPYFFQDLDFRLCRPDSSSRKICLSDAMLRLFARILSSDWVVLIRRPGRSVPVIRCSVFLRGSWFPIGSSWFSNMIVRLVLRRSGLQGSVACTITNNYRPFLIVTYITRWSTITVHYARCRACNMMM